MHAINVLFRPIRALRLALGLGIKAVFLYAFLLLQWNGIAANIDESLQ